MALSENCPDHGKPLAVFTLPETGREEQRRQDISPMPVVSSVQNILYTHLPQMHASYAREGTEGDLA
jgi:hypothetical protein